MAKPPTAQAFAQALDPTDLVDYHLIISQGAADATPARLLLLGEGVASYRLALAPEAVAMGVEIVSTPDYEPTLTGNHLKLWLTIAEDMRGSPLFDGAGASVGIELTITTTSRPPRTKQRTHLVRLANQ